MFNKQTTRFTATIVALAIIFLLMGCNLNPDQEDLLKIGNLPTNIPEVINEVVEEAQNAKEETATYLPLQPADISPDAFMDYQQAEDILTPYEGFTDGMLFTKAVDLEVVDIVDDSANAKNGFQFEAVISIRNNGFVTSPPVKVDCEVLGADGLVSWRWIQYLAPGETTKIRMGFTSGVLPLGTYDYTCIADPDNTLIEMNKLNNSRTESITLAMTNTDLRLVSIKEITRAAIIGYDHEFKVKVENMGPERSYKVFMRCSYQKDIATVEEQIVWVGPMATAGETIEVICGFNDVPAGTHTLIVEIDYWDYINESNEKNNDGELKFRH